jgi:hypothetical protein
MRRTPQHEADLGPVGESAAALHDLLEQGRQLHLAEIEHDLAALEPFDVQDIVDQAAEPLAILIGDGDQLLGGGVPSRFRVVRQQTERRGDRRQRRAQLVTDRGDELVLQPCGLLRHLLLERRVVALVGAMLDDPERPAERLRHVVDLADAQRRYRRRLAAPDRHGGQRERLHLGRDPSRVQPGETQSDRQQAERPATAQAERHVQRPVQLGHRPADRHRPVRDRGVAERRVDRNALEGVRRREAARALRHRRHQGGRARPGDELIGIVGARDDRARGVEQRRDPSGRKRLLGENLAQLVGKQADRERIERLSVADDRNLDPDQRKLRQRSSNQVRDGRLAGADDLPQGRYVGTARQRRAVGRQRVEQLLPGLVDQDDIACRQLRHELPRSRMECGKIAVVELRCGRQHLQRHLEGADFTIDGPHQRIGRHDRALRGALARRGIHAHDQERDAEPRRQDAGQNHRGEGAGDRAAPPPRPVRQFKKTHRARILNCSLLHARRTSRLTGRTEHAYGRCRGKRLKIRLEARRQKARYR